MHARHRSPGNGYNRSSSIGVGLAASRISPESSGRGHGFYNSEYRNFKRGFGRGQNQSNKAIHPPTPRKGNDIFMEAGRLAAQYLVSQGVLPPTVLSGKWHNSNLKKQAGDFQDFRSLEGGDNLHLPQDGRTSALARLGTSPSDTGIGRRRYTDDYNSMGSRNHMKGRRRQVFRNYGSDLGREYDDDDDNTISGRHEEQQLGKDLGNGLQKPGSSESAPKSEEAGDSESEMEKYNIQKEMATKPGSSNAGNDLQHETDVEHSKLFDSSTNLNAGTVEPEDGNNSDETEIKGTMEELPIHHNSAEVEPLSKCMTDLLAVCKFANVPTKRRSSLAFKAFKLDPIAKEEEKDASDIGPARRSEVLGEDDSFGGSSTDLLSYKSHDLTYLDSETSKDLSFHPAENVGELDHIYDVVQDKCKRSQSFPDRALLHDNEEDLIQGIPDLPRSSSMVDNRGEKRTLELSDFEEVTKKQKEWFQPLASLVDDISVLPVFIDKKGRSEEGRDLPSERVSLTINQHSFINDSQFSDGDAVESSVKCAEEKQLFPSSFKICDLNLMEADFSEHHHSNPNISYPTTLETKSESQIDIDLSMSNSNNSGEGSRHVSSSKGIEVIDLENGSTEEIKALNNSEKKSEPMYVGVTSDINDVPDSYDGLTLTEFLGNYSNNPHVPEDINPDYLQNDNINPLQNEDINTMQNGMGLHNGEGTLGDDDSIYMSLGEIPLSFLPPGWEQQSTQEYEKPF
ncbi:hypothetical protein SLA2020_015150 [Shorea laevis]